MEGTLLPSRQGSNEEMMLGESLESFRGDMILENGLELDFVLYLLLAA